MLSGCFVVVCVCMRFFYSIKTRLNAILKRLDELLYVGWYVSMV